MSEQQASEMSESQMKRLEANTSGRISHRFTSFFPFFLSSDACLSPRAFVCVFNVHVLYREKKRLRDQSKTKITAQSGRINIKLLRTMMLTLVFLLENLSFLAQWKEGKTRFASIGDAHSSINPSAIYYMADVQVREKRRRRKSWGIFRGQPDP